MRTLLRRPNLLAFPGGRPGFDPSHVAAKSCVFSVVPSGQNGLNLLNGLPGSVQLNGGGIPTLKIDNGLGPALVSTGSSIDISFNNPLTPNTPANILYAGFFNYANLSNNQFWLAFSTENGSWGFAPNIGHLYVGVGFDTGITPVAGDPYFCIWSASTVAQKMNQLLLNLRTGKIQTASVAMTGIPSNFGGQYSYGLQNGQGISTGGLLGPGMVGAQFISVPQMLQWAQDPWSFWYPQKFDLTQMLKAPAGGSNTATATSIGTSVASGIGASTVLSTAASIGTSTVSGIAISTATSIGTSSGTGTATGVSFSANTAVATSSGSSTAVGVTISTATSVGTSSGTGTALGVSISTVTSVGTSSGSSTATGVSISTVTSVGTSSGIGAALAIGSVLSNVGTASGFGTATGVGASLILSVGTSSGISIVTAISGGGGGGRQWRWQEGQKQLQNKSPSDTVKQSAAILSSRGGHARAASLTATQRTNIASTAAKARWK